MSASKLYTAEVLGLATSLSLYPLADDLPNQGSARSKSCGSTVTLGLETNAEGEIMRVGVKAHACAIGQAAAAIFATAAAGRFRAELAASLAEIEHWLSGGPLPQWSGLEAIAPARDYPARHGAIMLAWKAALDALPEGDAAL